MKQTKLVVSAFIIGLFLNATIVYAAKWVPINNSTIQINEDSIVAVDSLINLEVKIQDSSTSLAVNSFIYDIMFSCEKRSYRILKTTALVLQRGKKEFIERVISDFNSQVPWLKVDSDSNIEMIFDAVCDFQEPNL